MSGTTTFQFEYTAHLLSANFGKKPNFSMFEFISWVRGGGEVFWLEVKKKNNVHVQY